MNIFYACDDNYIWLMGISLESLFTANAHIADLNVYLLGDSIGEGGKRSLEAVSARHQRKITIIDAVGLPVPQSLCSRRWPKSAYIRLFSSALMPNDVDKAIYLDCDTIVTCGLDGLYEEDDGVHAVFGVRDCISRSYLKNIGLSKNAKYINAGVLLFDYRIFRKIDARERVERFVESFEGDICFADQDVLNGAFPDFIEALPNPSYNVFSLPFYYSYSEMIALRHPSVYYSNSEISEAVGRPIVVHFTTCMNHPRPWQERCDHPLLHEFRSAKSRTEWADKADSKLMVKGPRNKIIELLGFLPRSVSVFLLGIIHAYIKPLAYRARHK